MHQYTGVWDIVDRWHIEKSVTRVHDFTLPPRQFDSLAFWGYNGATVPTGGEPMRYNRSRSLSVRSASCDR